MSSIVSADLYNLDQIKYFDKKFSKEKQEIDHFKIFTNFVQKVDGSKKLFKAFNLSCESSLYFKSFLKLAPDRVKKIVFLKKHFKKIEQSLDVIKVLTITESVKKISKNISRKDFQKKSQKLVKIAIRIVEMILDILTFIRLGKLFFLYSLERQKKALAFSKRIFQILSGFLNFFKDVTKQKKHLDTKKRFETRLDLRLKIIFKEITTLHFLKIIKDISSIALSCFIIFEIAFQGATCLVGMKILLSAISLSSAMFVHFYKESFTYPKVELKK